MFASPDGIECLSNSENWHADGTFRVAAKYFYQLYVIQVWYKFRMIPCAWVLMNRRRKEDYVKVLKELNKAALAIGLQLMPKTTLKLEVVCFILVRI